MGIVSNFLLDVYTTTVWPRAATAVLEWTLKVWLLQLHSLNTTTGHAHGAGKI